MTDTTFLNIDSVTIAYGDDVVVSDLSLSLPVGELAALLGPSGCGKTTLLRAIAGFEPLQTGSISLAGEVLSRAGYTVPPERRAIGMMFQDLALFPHLNVADNIRFGIVGLPRKIQQQRIQMLLDLVGLPDSGRRYPHKLSGGQQQRIALARALAPHPRLLLMDEPFSSLDSELRTTLAREVRDILKVQEITTLMVTHSQTEADQLAGTVGVMEKGRLADIRHTKCCTTRQNN